MSGGRRYLLTVQAQGDGPFLSKGYLAIADLKGLKKIPEPGRGVPKMKGSQVIDDLTSYDPGKKAGRIYERWYNSNRTIGFYAWTDT